MRNSAWCLLWIACGLQAQTLMPEQFDWNTRWNNYVARTYDWKLIGAVAAETAFDQAFQLNKCGRPPYCFPHEFGGSLTRLTARNTIELGVGALLHEDLRRRPSGLSGFRQRLSYALLHVPLAKRRDGGWEAAYSRFAGTFGGVMVTSAWDGRPFSTPRVFEAFGWSMTSYFQDALSTEFEPDLQTMARRFAHRFRHHDRAAARPRSGRMPTTSKP